MKSLFLLVSVALLSLGVVGQNVGQKNDSLVNYSDINGLKQGVWKKTYENGAIEYEAYFVNNKPVGDFKRYDKKGDMVAYLIYDTITDFARAKFYYKSGRVMSEGNYLGHNKDSIWNYYNDNGIKYLEESYKNGVKDGVFRLYTKERVLLEETYWKDGKKSGSWKKFYASGELMWESNLVNGLLEGEAKSYYKNGKIYREGAFKNDLMDGTWFKYGKTGKVEQIYRYKDGYSPEADKEGEDMMRNLNNNKDKFDGPMNANDIDWLRSKSRY